MFCVFSLNCHSRMQIGLFLIGRWAGGMGMFSLSCGALILSVFSGQMVLAEPEAATILYIGDSHSHGGLGMRGGLDALLRNQYGYQLSFHAGCGTTTRQWMDGGAAPCKMEKPYIFHERDGTKGGGKLTAKYQSLKDNVQRSGQKLFAITQLGTNFASQLPQKIIENVNKLLLLIEPLRNGCIWIGPPSVDEDKARRNYPGLTNARIAAIEAAIVKALEGSQCHFISSRKFVADGGDGVHFSEAAGRRWAADAYVQIKEQLKNDSN